MCDFHERDYSDDELELPTIYQNQPLSPVNRRSNELQHKNLHLSSLLLYVLSAIGLQMMDKNKEKKRKKSLHVENENDFVKFKLRQNNSVAVLLLVNFLMLKNSKK